MLQVNLGFLESVAQRGDICIISLSFHIDEEKLSVQHGKQI